MVLAKASAKTKGVDSTNLSEEALGAAQNLSETTGAVVCVSGATDYIVYKNDYKTISNGHELMARITGMGCTASALVGACCAVSANDPFTATTAAMALMGIAGDTAAEKAAGPGTMQLHFLDALYQISKDDFAQRLKLGAKS